VKKLLIRAALIVLFLGFAGAVGTGIGVYVITSDLPDVAALNEYQPRLTTRVHSRDGVLMAELFDEHRYEVDPLELPDHVRLAFLAAEDSGFYQHQGLDFMGILRAAIANLRSMRVVQGGSTITQQVAKRLLLTPEKTFQRKFKELALALRIEKNLSKDQILALYLNEIYLGHKAYGVEAAARVYFGVGARELTPAQAALLAGLPKAPSRYDPYRHPERALNRRAYVLTRMGDEQWLTPEEVAEAQVSELELAGYINPFNTVAPFFTEQVRRELDELYGSELLLGGGLDVVTTMDTELQYAAQRALKNGIERVDRKMGYRGPLASQPVEETEAFLVTEQAPLPKAGSESKGLVLAVDKTGLTLLAKGIKGELTAKELKWTLKRGQALTDVFKPGDVVGVRFAPVVVNEKTAKEGAAKEDSIEPPPMALVRPTLFQDPQLEGALVCLNANTGEVLAAVGGYKFTRSQFNRAVQAKRQAGSSIKPLIYGAAIDSGMTPATIIYDSPIVYDSDDLDEKWKPNNYSQKFYGATTLREALIKSRNVVTIKVLQDMGIPHAVKFLRKAGITSRISPDLSMALGASDVTALELASVYSIFATGGMRVDPAFIQKTTDRYGALMGGATELLPEESASELGQEAQPAQTAPGSEPETEPAPSIDPQVAYQINYMMQSVITEGTGRRARGLDVPAAGKTGTTNDMRDAWFSGFTPDLVTTVWVGYDEGHSMGKGQTGGTAAAPIWKEFMDTATKKWRGGHFPIPEGIEYARIDADTGELAGPATKRSFQAAFVTGTAPAPKETTERENTPEWSQEEEQGFSLDEEADGMDALR
jgi:penicillin-binding protein 1A